MLSHPASLCRDTSLYAPLRNKIGKASKLKHLAKEQLNMDIQDGEHSSVDDAIAAMMIFKQHKKDWDTTAKKIELRKEKLRAKNVGVELRRLEASEQKKSSTENTDNI